MPVDIKSFFWNHAVFEKDNRESSKAAVVQCLPHQPFLSSKSHHNSLIDSIFSQKPIR